MKMNRKKSIIFLTLFAGMAIMSCERDDICPENSMTTPDALVEFYSTDNGREEAASGTHLKIYGIRGTDTLFTAAPSGSGTSILLPLDFEAKESTYLVSHTYSVPSSETDAPAENVTLTDTLTIKYEPVLTFISKACGYCFTFEGMTVDCTTAQTLNGFVPSIESEPAYGHLLSSRQVVVKLYLKNIQP